MPSIPTYQEMMLPLLRVLDQAARPVPKKEFCELVAEAMGLNEEQRQARLPSGQRYIYNRSGWAGWYMQQATLVEKVKPGVLKITEVGKALLATNPDKVDNRLLMTYPAFAEKMASYSSEAEADEELR